MIEQIIAVFGALGKQANFHYFRTSDGYEIDLVIESAGERWGVEIKFTSSPSLEDLRKLRKTSEFCGCTRHFLVSRTLSPVISEQGGSLNLQEFLKMIMEESDGNNPNSLAGINSSYKSEKRM